MPEKLNNRTFISKANEVHQNKYNYDLVKYVNNYTNVDIICQSHGLFTQKPVAHLAGKGCKKCGFNKISLKNKLNLDEISILKKSFIDKSITIHKNKYDYSLIDFKNLTTKIKIICPIHGAFEQIPHNHLNNNGCNRCKLKFNSIEDFIKQSIEIHGNIYDYSMVNFKKTTDKVEIICSTHGIFKQVVSSHISGSKCFKCTRLNKKSNANFIEECKIKHNEKYDYSLVEYNGVNEKIKIICPLHGIFIQRAGAHISGHGCNICKESKGELKISNYLKSHNINFEREKTFDGCKNERLLPFDFYLEIHNLIIEFDGRQHYEAINRFGGEEGLNKTKFNDSIKNNYCRNNNIRIIRINYKQNINNILDNYFNI